MDSPRSKRLQITKDHRPSPISLPTDLVRSRERNREVLLSTSSFRSEPLRLSDPKPIRIASPIPFGYAYPYVTFRRPGGVPDAFWAIDARRNALRHRFARFRGRLEGIWWRLRPAGVDFGSCRIAGSGPRRPPDASTRTNADGVDGQIRRGVDEERRTNEAIRSTEGIRRFRKKRKRS